MSKSPELNRCPVCGGKGMLPPGFYNLVQTANTRNTEPELCRTCNGKGFIIWPSHGFLQ